MKCPNIQAEIFSFAVGVSCGVRAGGGLGLFLLQAGARINASGQVIDMNGAVIAALCCGGHPGNIGAEEGEPCMLANLRCGRSCQR